MNIFATHPEPYDCARYLCDQRLNKMISETNQILARTLQNYGVRDERFPPVPATYRGNRFVLWAGETTGNYHWLLQLAWHYGAEWIRRRGRIHRSTERMRFVVEGNEYFGVIPPGPILPHPRSSEMRDDIECTYEAYRELLARKWLAGPRPGQTRWRVPMATLPINGR